jgi:hypothetical protein
LMSAYLDSPSGDTKAHSSAQVPGCLRAPRIPSRQDRRGTLEDGVGITAAAATVSRPRAGGRGRGSGRDQ